MEDIKLKFAAISFSGGMDSSTLLLRLLYEGYVVIALSFDYGQKHSLELTKAKELIEYLYYGGYHVVHRVITLTGLSALLDSTLVRGGADIPEGYYKEENMRVTVVPNRNKIFSSIVQAVALSTANRYKTVSVVALGIHQGDHDIYPDCRQEFRDADLQAFRLGNWDSDKVTMYTPYLDLTKFEILQNGVLLCEKLQLNFDEVYKRTNTSYKPIFIGNDIYPGHPEFGGNWYPDYKSASSIERVEAFIKLGRPDPLQYADESGLVSWRAVTNYFTNLINKVK
jgi:7-cyano-7-deazaguanine synthase